MSSGTLAGFQRWSDWLAGQSVISPGAFSWLMRRHRSELLKSGQVIVGSGRRPTLLGPKFDEVVIDLLRQEQGGSSAPSVRRQEESAK